jgi:hypothetical protein
MPARCRSGQYFELMGIIHSRLFAFARGFHAEEKRVALGQMILRFLFQQFKIQLIPIEVHIAPLGRGFQDGKPDR